MSGYHVIGLIGRCYTNCSSSDTVLLVVIAVAFIAVSLLGHQGYQYRRGGWSIFGSRSRTPTRTVFYATRMREEDDNVAGMAMVADARREAGIAPDPAAGSGRAGAPPGMDGAGAEGGHLPAHSPQVAAPGSVTGGMPDTAPGVTSWAAGGGLVAPGDSVDIVDAVDAAYSAGGHGAGGAGAQGAGSSGAATGATGAAAGGSAPAGWYDDPERPGQQRWWSGSAWAPSGAGPQTA